MRTITLTKSGKNKEYLGLLVIPLEFLIGTIISRFSFEENQFLSTVLNVSIFIIGFLVMIWLFKDFLKSQWQLYKHNKLWLKLIINVCIVIGAYGILALSRSFLNKPLSINDSNQLSSTMISLMLIGSIQPVIAPFAEELTFRYLLFGKFNSGILKCIMFFVSSILFGLVHINNFNGDWIQTIPYMLVGAYFAIIYSLFNNIWSTIIVHWLFNCINSVIPILFLVVLKLIGTV